VCVADSPGDDVIVDSPHCPVRTHFLCHDYSACIPREWICDEASDCVDNSDEGSLVGCAGLSMTSIMSAHSLCSLPVTVGLRLVFCIEFLAQWACST
jgi:Low-density lipoprotein receptor domain class A